MTQELKFVLGRVENMFKCSSHDVFLCPRIDRSGVYKFLARSFVSPSVCPFVRLFVRNWPYLLIGKS